jgi:hypothetical protein
MRQAWGAYAMRRFSCIGLSGVLGIVALTPWSARADVDSVFQYGFEPGFQVLTPPIEVAAESSGTWCYYFHAPNTQAMGIRRWSSTMLAGTHHVILYATHDSGGNPSDWQPPGTLTQTPCSLSGPGSSLAAWVYAAHAPSQDLVFPPDDGGGVPLAVEVPAGETLFLQMYVINNTIAPITTSAVLQAEGLDPAVAYTKTATYLTYANLFIPSPSVGSMQNTCATPSSAKFWWLSTRTHQFASQSRIINSGSDVVVSTDWQHPAAATFGPPAFFQFSSGLTYEGTYNNSSGHPITDGDSEATNENCVGIGYFFPAAHAIFCLNNIGPF